MRTASKLILATLAATALLALTGSGASARKLSVTERSFEFIWNEATGKTRLEFGDMPGGLPGTMGRCNVTFLGTFLERTIAKQTTAKIGEIRHATRGGCVASEAEFRSLPWEVRYRGFTGRLPEIATVSIGVIGLSARIREPFNVECTITTTATEPAVFILEEITGGAVTSVSADESARITLTGAERQCEQTSPAFLRGKGLVLNLPSTAKLTLTLI